MAGSRGAGPTSFKLFIILAHLNRENIIPDLLFTTIDGGKESGGASFARAHKKDAKWLLGYFGYKPIKPNEYAPQKVIINKTARSILNEMFDVGSGTNNEFSPRLSPTFPSLKFTRINERSNISMHMAQLDSSKEAQHLKPTDLANAALQTIKEYRSVNPKWDPSELVRHLEKNVETEEKRSHSETKRNRNNGDLALNRSNSHAVANRHYSRSIPNKVYPLELYLEDGITPLNRSTILAQHHEFMSYKNGLLWYSIFHNNSTKSTGPLHFVYLIDKQLPKPQFGLHVDEEVFGHELHASINTNLDPTGGGLPAGLRGKRNLAIFFGDSVCEIPKGSFNFKVLVHNGVDILYSGSFIGIIP